MNRVSLTVSILCYLAVATQANPARFADSDGASIEDLAALVCKNPKNTKHQLGRISSFAGVADFLSGLTAGHKLVECRNEYLDSIQQLVHVVETAKDNVCGEEKLALIEDFQHKFVSKTKRDLKIQKKGSKAPRMAKLFFMQYATEVSSACEQSLMASVASKRHSLPAEEAAQVEKMGKIVELLGMDDLSKGYKSIYLLWNAVDSLNLSEMYKVSKYIASEGQAKVNFQMKDARPILGIQAICQYRLKPVYARTIMPLLRLIDLGYYPQSQQLLVALASEPAMKGQFYAAQICESLLPLGMYSNEQLSADQVVALTQEEASQLKAPELEGVERLQGIAPPVVEIAPVSVTGQQLSASDKISIEKIKLEVAQRGKVMSRLLRQVWSHVKTQLKSAVKGFKIFRKNKDSQKLEPLDEAALEQADTNSLLLDGGDEKEEGALIRSRRGLFSPDPSWIRTPWYGKLAFLVILIIGGYYLIILYAIKVALFGLPSLIAFCFTGEDSRVDDFIFWLWRIGNPLYEDFGFTPMFPNRKQKKQLGRQ